MTTNDIPSGFQVWEPTSLFMSYIIQIGAIYKNEASSVFGLRIDETHANMHGVAHGGLLATLADCAFGTYISQECKAPVVTVNMSLDYLNVTKIGDWLEAHVKIDKQGRRLIYASGSLQAQGKTLVKVNGIFAVRN